MKTYTRLELLIIDAAIALDKYTYEYFYNDYINNIGTEEVYRIRHVNDLIKAIADNGNDFIDIIRQLNDDIDFITFDMKETGNTKHVNQLNDAYDILLILNQVA